MNILNYHIISIIGAGGMGQVYLAQNMNIHQYVAIKALHPKYASNTMLRERFKQEAQMLCNLDHPNIVKFINYIENEQGVFLIMEYVEGMTLDELILKKTGLIVEKRAYPMMCEILDAFSYAHAHGIVHRDIKPNNIIITPEGHIKVMDFGIAQIVSEADQNTHRMTMGTPEYMSPEQVHGLKVDKRSDIYSLGVLFHQMLTGRAPFDTTTLSTIDIMQRVVSAPLPRMKEFYPYVSDGIQKVVDKAVEKNPDKRFRDCAEMKKEVKKVIDPDPKKRTPLYIGIAVAVLLLGAGFFIWDYHRTKIYYYKDYAEYFGVPEGIGKVSKSEMEHRASTYRLEYNKGKLRRLTLVNSKDKPIPHSDTENLALRNSDVAYFYTDGGKLDYKKVYDPYGKLLYKLDYDENLKTAAIKYDDEYGTAARLPSNTTDTYAISAGDVSERSLISRYLLDYDEETGLLKSMLYASGENNERVGDSDNVYGMEYRYDDHGRIIALTYLGVDENPTANKIGLSTRKYKYDDDDNWVEVSYYAIDGSPSHDGQNCSVVKIAYDDHGNRKSELYFTADGTPVIRTDAGSFGFVYEYSDDGNRLRQTYVDEDLFPLLSSEGIATQEMAYNDDGFVTEVRMLDTKGNLTYYQGGDKQIAMVQYKRNEVGLPLEEAYFDTSENPIEVPAGMQKVKYAYDEVGNVTEISYYDADENPAKLNGYYTTVTCEYDEYDRPQKIRYYDAAEKLTDDGNGCGGYDRVYDKQGNLFQMKNIGIDGKSLVKSNDGEAYIELLYDESGNVVSLSYFDENSKPCCNTKGIQKIENVYEPSTNQMIERKVYNAKGLSETQHYEYDKRGNIVKDYVTTKNGALKPNTVVIYNVYDTNNRLSKQWCTNLAGKKVRPNGLKFCSAEYKYDRMGNTTEVKYFDTDARPTVNRDGAHTVQYKYDDANRKIYEKNLGTDNKPVKGSEGCPEVKYAYDSKGNLITATFLDGYGKPCLNYAGFHKLTQTYNNRNLLATRKTTDEKGNLVNNKEEGWAEYSLEYDSHGNITIEKTKYANGKDMYEYRYEYNEHNKPTLRKSVSANGSLKNYNGIAKIMIIYEDNGVIPKSMKYYTASNALLGTLTYNKKNGEWM